VNGEARTTAAITFVNAMPTGRGCAAGVELGVEARVSLTSEGSDRNPTFEIPQEHHTPLVEETLRLGVKQYYPNEGAVVRLSLRSEIPVARGLKSSSAVSTAILLAVARAAHRRPTALEIGRGSAEVGRRVGVSATGALDDALAGLGPGFVITDNERGEVLMRGDLDPSLGAALYIPVQSHPPSPNLVGAFSAEREAGARAVRAALDGDWATAMRINTEVVERVMGYSYGGIRERLRAHGAVASGVSGLGPALAAVAPRDRLPDLLGALPTDSARRIVVPFARASASGEDPA
jgi:shikimate kinase